MIQSPQPNNERQQPRAGYDDNRESVAGGTVLSGSRNGALSRPRRLHLGAKFICAHAPRLSAHGAHVSVEGVAYLSTTQKWRRGEYRQPLRAGNGIPAKE